jgi:hypothetical protein
MYRILLAVMLAWAFAIASPAEAQVRVPHAQADAAVSRLQKATSGAEQITTLLVGIVNDPAYLAAQTPEEVAEAIAALGPQTNEARRQIRAIGAELASLRPVAGSSDPVELRMTDRVVDDIASLAVQVDDLLGEFLDLGDALAKGDQVRVERAGRSVMRGSVSVVQAQALMLRGRLAMVPSDASAHGRINALACFYDGLSGFQQGIYELVSRTDAIKLVASARNCMTSSVATGRVSLDRETTETLADPGLMRLRASLAPVHRSLFDELDAGAAVLGRLQASLANSDDAVTAGDRHGQAIIAFEQRLQALARQEVAVIAAAN